MSSSKKKSAKKPAKRAEKVVIEKITEPDETLGFTREYCIEDIRRVAEENPDSPLSRDFYRTNGSVPEAVWTGYFGSYTEFLRQANLKDSRYKVKVLSNYARQASLDNLREVSELRKNFGTRYKREKNRRFKTLIGCSDIHDSECDPFYLRVMLETIKTVDPDVVCIAGDFFDLPEFSKYTTDLREFKPVERILAGQDILRQMRSAAPNAQIDLIEGNHEARFIRHLSESSQPLMALMSELHDLSVGKIFGLDEFEINYIAQSNLCTLTESQSKKETAKNHQVYWGSLIAHHFPDARGLGLPGFNGHHHQHYCWTETSIFNRTYQWHQLGSGHRRQAGYTDGSKWNNGFIIANVDTHYGFVNFDYVDVGSTFSLAAGTWFYRQPEEFYPFLIEEMETKKKMYGLGLNLFTNDGGVDLED